MRYTTIEGIILKRINVGEADRILVVYSKELGKIKVIGKGLRKITSRRAAHLEVFSEVSMVIRDSKTLPYVGEVTSLYSYITLHKSFRKIAIAYHLSEIVDRLLPEHEKNEHIYNMFVTFLRELDREGSENIIRTTVRLFVHNILSQLGYLNKSNIKTYSQLIGEIENVIERPLATVNLLYTVSKYPIHSS